MDIHLVAGDVGPVNEEMAAALSGTHIWLVADAT